MRKLIIDTNVWYSITNEDIRELKEKNYILIAPNIILNELHTSPNIYKSEKNLEDLKKAIQTILNNSKSIDFIDLNPFEYILKDIFPEIQPTSNHQFYLSEFEALLNLSYEDAKNKYVQRPDISDLTNFINDTSKEYKKDIKKNKNNFKNLDTKEWTESLILTYANDNLKSLNKSFPLIKKLDDKYELLLNSFNELLREISRSEQKLENNDWIDIFIMTYVNQNDMFWTKEKSKQRLINKSNLGHYLYENEYD